MTSGAILREAREQKGYKLETVARRLRIRPDILRSIENGDFSAMPPRGYARNMVNAYARYLGLNPTDIVTMFLDEAYANQVSRARSNAPMGSTSGFSIGHNSRIESSRENRRERAEAREIDKKYESNERGRRGRSSGLSRDTYDDRTKYARNDYGHGRDSSMNGRSFETSHRGGYTNERYGELASVHRGASTQRRGYGGALGNSYGNMYSGPSTSSGIMAKLPFIIIGLVVIVIIILVLSLVFGSKAQTKSTDVSTLPVSGISDTTAEDDAAAETATAAKKTAPTSAVVSYCVASSGDECYVEIYEGDTLTGAEVLTDTKETVVNVTDKWTITTWRPDSLSLKVDGKAVSLITDDSYGGMSYYTVDFNAILNQWNIDNGVYASSSSSSTKSSTSSSSSSSSKTS